MPRSKNPNPRQLSNKKSSDDNDSSSSDNKHSSNGTSSCDVVPSPDPSNKCESTSAAKAIDKRPCKRSILTQEKLSIKAPITKTSSSTFYIDLTRRREEEEKNNNNNSSTLRSVLVDDTLSEERPISPNNNFLNEWKGPRFGVTKPKVTKYEDGDTPKSNVKQGDLYVWDWVRKNLTLHPGSRLSASEVLSTYEADQEKMTHYDSSNVDLRASCHKVGMLVRRMFPDIQRCKITVSGRRVWVYKNLALRRNIEDPPDEEATLADTLTPSYYKSLWNTNSLSNSLVLQRSSVYDRISKQNSIGRSSTSAAAASLHHHHHHQQPSPTSHHTTTAANKACNISTSSSASSNNTADITQWLSENYEYSDGSCVRSSDVLEQYNRIHNSQVRYLSHIGRIIRIVFPDARHIRRSCQGGKREWLYQNIRPCEQLLESYSSVGKSLIRKKEDGPIKHSSKAKNSAAAGGGIMLLQLQSVVRGKNNSNNNGAMIKKENEQQQNDEPTTATATTPSGLTFLGKPILSMKRRYSASFTPPMHDMNGGGGESTSAAESRIAATSEGVLANSVINTNAVTPPKRSRSTTVEVICSNDGDKSELSSPASTANHDEMTFSPGSPSTRFSQCFSEGDAAETPQRVDEDDETVADGFEHNPYTRGLVDGDLRVRGEFKKSDDDKGVMDDDEVVHMNGKMNNDGDDVEAADPHFEWKFLKTIPSEQFGWSRLPASGGRRSSDNQLYEWVRFEGHLVCDGKRVFRELIIKNNFSVKVFALNRCVITPVGDLVRNCLRTRYGMMKIFKVLSEMRLCRGVAAFQFSEVTAHSQVIATTEIWSSRVHPQETLRHRSVNCQFLFMDKKDGRSETCPKCLHLFKVTGLGGGDGGSPHQRTATPPPPPQSPKQSPPPPQPSINNDNTTTTSPSTSTTTNATTTTTSNNNNDDEEEDTSTAATSPCDGDDTVQS